MKDIAESLAGRADIIELETLSLAEIRARRRRQTSKRRSSAGFPGVDGQPEIEPWRSTTRTSRRISNATSVRWPTSAACGISNVLARLRAALGQPAQQGRSGARHRHRAVDRQPVALRARSVRPDHLARALVLESHQVLRQEPQALSQRHRLALRPAQHPLPGCLRQSPVAAPSGRPSSSRSSGTGSAARAARAASSSGATARAKSISSSKRAAGSSSSRPSGWRPPLTDAINLEFVRRTIGAAKIAGGGIVCRARHGYPLADGFRLFPSPNWVDADRYLELASWLIGIVPQLRHCPHELHNESPEGEPFVAFERGMCSPPANRYAKADGVEVSARELRDLISTVAR